MRVIAGTSGYSYKEWKGSFYPADLPAAKMLPFYASHFGSVEINATFYRMPDAKMLAKWAGEVPDGFTFVLKAPQRITHIKRLKEVEDDVRHLFEVAEALGPKLGPVLFQLPPNYKKNVEVLASFLRTLPPDHPCGFEFRHNSWFDDEVYAVLRERNIALCAADVDDAEDEKKALPTADQLPPTANWGYVRLRRVDYTDDELAEWGRRILERPWNDAYVFFKHEDEGKGPAFARRFLDVLPAQS